MIILFDLDGTLIDSTEAILESFHYACKSMNSKSPDDAAIKALIGHPLDVMFHQIGISDDLKWDYVNAYKLHYRDIATQKTVLLPFAQEAVVEASKIARLGVVTTKTAKYSKELMEFFGLMDYFEVLIGREDVINPKPHQEPIEKALEQMSATKSNSVWMLGDTWMDIQSADNAGVNSIALLSGYGSLESLSTYTNIIKNDALEAIKYLQKSG